MVQGELRLTRPLRIAFPIVSSLAWRGGFNYLLSLSRALADHAADQIEVVAFLGEDAAAEDILAFSSIRGIEVHTNPAFSQRRRYHQLAKTLLQGLDKEAADVFTKSRIDIVFESARFYGARLLPASIAWFPDFQHRRLPALFGRVAWWRREIGFRMQIHHGRTILVSSKDAQQDCVDYYQVPKERIHVLKFPAVINAQECSADPHEVLAQYRLPGRFVYLPNQFWAHKNHAIVIDAIGILCKQQTPITVVATGNTSDPRNPMLFDNLLARLREVSELDSFRILGVVPRSHVIALLRSCSALVNPSLCEGWNSSVEEAKLFGTPMILSSLKVHKEQAGRCAKYFEPNDAQSLADLLLAAISDSGVTPSPRQLTLGAHEQSKSFAKSFATIAAQARMKKNQ